MIHPMISTELRLKLWEGQCKKFIFLFLYHIFVTVLVCIVYCTLILTILLWVVYKTQKAKPTSGTCKWYVRICYINTRIRVAIIETNRSV